MKLLILGGSVFLGRHLVEAAQRRGHAVMLFNRGKSNPELFGDVPRILGDRDGGLEGLAGGHWDAAIDCSGYLPRLVGDSARVLANRVGHYSFVSSISVYADRGDSLDESSELGRLDDETVELVDGVSYGPLKALCEAAAEAAMPGRVLTVRPGLIVGPNDPTDRFTYWPLRIARGGPFVAPEGPEAETQLIDVRDLADWIIRAVEAGLCGVFNATGPAERLDLGAVFEACAEAAGKLAEPVWCDPGWIEAAGLRPFMDLPLWVPEEGRGMMRVDCSRAIAAGLEFRPLIETAADTLAWAREARAGVELRAGLSAEREAELLAQVD